MKICLLNNLYKPYDRGGAEKITEIIFNGFKDQGHEVFVVTTRPCFLNGRKKELELVYYLNSFYYNLELAPLFLRLFWHIFDIFNVFKYFQIKKIIKKERPDVVVSNNLKGLGFLLPSLFLLQKIKHIHILHDIQLLHPSGLMFYGKEEILESKIAKIYQKINSFLFKDVEYVVSPSKWILDIHEGKGFFKKSQKQVILNPIIGEQMEKKTVGDDVFRFLFVGHLSKAKGVPTVLKAYDDFLKIYKNKSELILVGDDRYLCGEDRDLILQNGVKVIGRKENREVKRLMLESNLLIVASEVYENSPTVIYEALTCDLPFVSTGIGGAVELADLFGAPAFEPGDHQTLVDLMIEATKKAPRLDAKIDRFKIEYYIKNILKFIS